MEPIEHQLAKALEQYEASDMARQDVALVARIAGLYQQKGDLKTALEWYNYASVLENHEDPALVRKAAEIELKLLDRAIKDFESWLADYGNAENAAEVRSQLDDLNKRKDQLLINLPKSSESSELFHAPTQRIYFFQ